MPSPSKHVRPIPARDLRRIFNPPSPAYDRFEKEYEETPFDFSQDSAVGGWIGVAIMFGMAALIFGGFFALGRLL